MVCLSLAVVLWIGIFFVPIAFTQTPTPSPATESNWDFFEKWVGRAMIMVGFISLLAGFVVYVFKGRNWDELHKAISVKDSLITSLTQENADIKADNADCERKLARSRQIRLLQKQVIFRMSARLEQEGKEFDDILSQAGFEDFDLL